jgi:hypothetical protein
MTIGAEGEHWYKTWLMLRDSRLYDPWFARGPGAVRTGPVDLDPVHLHDWTVDVVGAGARYADLVHAVLARDVAPVFNALSVPTVLWQHPHDARTLFGDPAQRLDRDLPCYQGEDLVTAMRQVQASMRS